MSAATKAVLEAAIQDHLAEEGQGDITTAWVLVSASTTMQKDDGGSVWVETPDGQQRYATLGLLESGQVLHRGFVYAVMTQQQIERSDDA